MDYKYYAEKGMGKCNQQISTDNMRPHRHPVRSIEYQLEESVTRNAFIKDRDRILYSRPFRRLEHKAQIFSHEKGDHYRTRLTHTIEVSQIARSLCRNLDLNQDLVDAIAMGHDIGHTPFGHQGERTLNDIMSGSDLLGGQIKYPLFHGGFKHNYQGIRTLDCLESIYDQDCGLYLTWPTIDGILKHTKTRNDTGDPICHIEKFSNHYKFYFYDKETCSLDYQYPITLEGQIVSLSDEIAQRQHDLDDALADSSLNISVDAAISEIQKTISNTLASQHNRKGNEPLTSMVKTFQYKLESIKKREGSSRQRRNLVSTIIEYFIIDATYQSMENIFISESEKFVFKESNNCFKSKIISLSVVGEKIDDAISTYINNRIVNSYDVNRFDAKAVYIIRQLYKAYYKNPKQMPDNVLKRLSTNLKKLQSSEGTIHVNCDTENDDLFVTDLRTGSAKRINYLLDFLRIDIDKSFPFSNNKYTNYFNTLQKDTCLTSDYKRYCSKNDFFKKDSVSKFEYDLWLANTQPSALSDTESNLLIYLAKANYFFMSSICDYIAGMTDNFAKDEFRKLYVISN